MVPRSVARHPRVAPSSARASHHRPSRPGSRSLLAPLLLLLACLLVATSCADTPPGPRLRGARAAIDLDTADWAPPPPCPPLDGSVFPPDLQAPSTVEAGTIDGSFSVTPSGAAVYSIPLSLPPGRAGMQPSLAVTYDSEAGDGPLGMGFSVAGLSAISRCPKNMTDDGEIAAVRDAFGDPLCLDGMRLVSVLMPLDPNGPPTYFPEYRTVPETFSKIVPDLGEDEGWDLNNGPRSFSVHTKSGQILEYGSSADSRVLAHGGAVRSWLLKQVRDRWGNTIDHSYVNELHPTEGYTVEHAPVRIDYTGHPIAPATRAVVFEYIRREEHEAPVLYARGMALRRSLRLTRIAMLAPAPTLVREYRFSYTAGAATGRTLLDEIQECAADGACKPPTRFLWHTGGSPGFMTLPTTIEAPQSPRGSLMTLDMTGDGLEDLVLTDVDMTGGSENPLTNWTVAPNLSAEITPSYFDAAHHAYQHGHPGAVAPIQPELGTPIDYNQDGRTDILVHDMYATDSTWRVLLAQQDGTFASHDTGIQRLFTLSSPPPLLLRHPEASAHLADVDGDGVSDLIQCAYNGTEYNWFLHRWVPSVPGFTQAAETISALYGYHCDTELHTVDADIDGKVDLLVPNGKMTGNGVSPGPLLEAVSYVHPSKKWRRRPLLLPRPLQQQGRILFLDVNGDGLPDAVETGFPDRQLRTFINTGAGFAAAVDSLPAPVLDADLFAGIAVSLDYNGDGRRDLLLPMPGSGGVPSWKILQSTGSVTGATFAVVDPGLPIDLQLLAGAPPTLVDPRGPRVTDIDGDGNQDLLLTLSGTVQVFKSTLHEEDLLAGVVDGLAAHEPWEPAFRPRVEIDYAHLIDLDTTTAGHPGATAAESRTYLPRDGITDGGCAYPVRCVVGPRRVVSGYRLDTAAADPRRFALAYRDGRYHRLGRGFLGFSARIVRDLDTGAGTAEYYDNVTYDGDLDTFPFAGQLVEEHRWAPALSYDGQPGDGAIELRYRSITPHAVPLLGGRTYFNVPGITNLRRMQGTYDAQLGQSVEAYVRETAVSGAAEELGTTLHVIADYDDYGNVLHETTSTPGADLTIDVHRTVANDEAAWHLGMVEALHECSTAGGMTQCRTTTREYAAQGYVYHEIAGSDDDPETELGIYYQHDPLGNIFLTIAMDAFGDQRHACVRYDAEGLFPAVHRNPEGHVTRLKHHPGFGAPMAVIDPSGRVTQWARDGFGRVARELRPDGTETVYALTRTKDGGYYQDQWNIKQWIQESGGRSDTIEHDSLGRAVRWWRQGVQLSGGPAPRVVQEIGFDALGEHVAWRTVPHPDPGPPNPLLPFDSYQYDGMGRLVRHVTPWQAETTYHHDAGAVVVTRPGNAVTVIENDALGRPVHIAEPHGAETTYSYGPFGGLWSVTDAGGAETLTERDAYGRVRRQVDPDRGETILHYNGYGELTSSLDAAQREVTLERDGLGRLVRRVDQDGVTHVRWDTAPNGLGQLAEVESPEGHLRSYAYDAFGRLTQTSLTIDSDELTVGVSYDAYSRPEVLTYPEAPGAAPFAVRREYDAWGHLIAVKDDATGAAFWEVTNADGAGRITGERLGGGAALTTRSYYNDRNRVYSIHTQAGGAVVQNLSYEYDARLNVARRADAVNGQEEWFLYDKLDRLTCTLLGAGQVCMDPYEYAPNGNLTKKPGVGTYTYDPNDKPHAVRTAGWDDYWYDDVGNQVSRPGVTIEYTAFDLPRKFTLSQAPGGTIELAYDGLGQRIRKQGLTEDVVYFGDLYERVTNFATGEVEHRYHVGSAERVVATVARKVGAADEVRYVHMAALGSVDVVTRPSGAVVDQRSYDAFGARRDPIWSAPPPASFTSETRLGFTGHEADEELGLVNMKGRIYDPRLGRFLTPDPVIARPHFSQGWNPYSYGLNSPLAYVDPTGFTEEDTGPVQGEVLYPVPNPDNPNEWLYLIPPGPGEQPPTTQQDAPVDMAYLAAAPPPVDMGVWGSGGFVGPQSSPGLEKAQRILCVYIQVGIGVGEQVGEIALDAAKFLVLNALTFGGYGTYKLGRSIWDGYKEDGVVGAVNAVNLLHHFEQNVIDSYQAAARGDYRAAGRSGVSAVVVGATIVLGAAGAAEALATRGGAGAATAGGAVERAGMRPYGGPGGGHHVPAKSAFTGASGYDLNKALAIPNAELARLGIKHRVVTASQMRGYRAFAQTGEPLTWEAMARIESDALVAGGMSREVATATVNHGIAALKQAGVAGPTRIPWGR